MKKKLKNILITNDDGYNAVGLGILKEIAYKLTDEVFVVFLQSSINQLNPNL